MEEEREVGNNRELLTAVICIAMSVLFSKMSLASLFFNLPLLLFVPRIRETGKAVLTFVITMVIIVGWTLLDYKEFLNTDGLGIILFVLYYEVVSSIGAIVWTACRNYSDSVLRKLVICSFPIAAIGLAYSISLGLPFAEGWRDGIKATIPAMFNVEAFGINAGAFGELFLSVLKLTMVPIGLVFSALPILVSEFWLKKSDDNWQFGFANMKMPDSYIWIFMAAWALVLVTFVADIPDWLITVGYNVALGLSLHYYVGGLSIITARYRKRTQAVTAFRIFVPVVLLSLLPGVNFVVISGLTVLGALETWIKLR